MAHRVGQELGAAWSVSTSFLQHHGPTTTEAFEAVRRSRTLSVAIQPLLLTAGEHWRDDVPKLTKRVRSNPGVQLLEPLGTVELAEVVLDTLSPLARSEWGTDICGPATEAHGTGAAPLGSEGEPNNDDADPARKTPRVNSAEILTHRVLLVPGGSRVQDLRQHFKPLAAEVRHVLGQNRSGQVDTQTKPIAIDLLARPSGILETGRSGSTTLIVPLLVARGRVYDSMVDAADQIEAEVTPPVGESTGFARAIAAHATTHQEQFRRD